MMIPDQLVIKVPKPLADKTIRAAVGLGLFKIAIGRDAGEVPEGVKVTQRIKLSDKGKQYLRESLKHYDNRQEVIIDALTWIYNQPEHVRNARI